MNQIEKTKIDDTADENGQPAVILADRQVELIARALAEPRRVKILKELSGSGGVMACQALSLNAEVSAPTVSHHLKELEGAGLLQVTRQGKFASLTLHRDVLKAYRDFLDEI